MRGLCEALRHMGGLDLRVVGAEKSVAGIGAGEFGKGIPRSAVLLSYLILHKCKEFRSRAEEDLMAGYQNQNSLSRSLYFSCHKKEWYLA